MSGTALASSENNEQKPVSTELLPTLVKAEPISRLKQATNGLARLFSLGNGVGQTLCFGAVLIGVFHLGFLAASPLGWLLLTILAIKFFIVCTSLYYEQFYRDKIEDGMETLFVSRFTGFSTKQKLAMVLAAPFIIGVGLASGAFTFSYVKIALVFIFSLIGISCPHILLFVLAVLFSILTATAIAFAMVNTVKKILQKEWLQNRLTMYRELWQIDKNATVGQKIWRYTKAILITLLLVSIIGIAAYAVYKCYGLLWVKALAPLGHQIFTQFLHIKVQMGNLLNRICVYVFALPLKIFFNSEYCCMVMVNFLKNINKAGNKNKKEKENQEPTFNKRAPFTSERILSIAAHGFYKFCLGVGCMSNIFLKIFLAIPHVIAAVQIFFYETAKGIKGLFNKDVTSISTETMAKTNQASFFAQSKPSEADHSAAESNTPRSKAAGEHAPASQLAFDN